MDFLLSQKRSILSMHLGALVRPQTGAQAVTETSSFGNTRFSFIQ